LIFINMISIVFYFTCQILVIFTIKYERLFIVSLVSITPVWYLFQETKTNFNFINLTILCSFNCIIQKLIDHICKSMRLTKHEKGYCFKIITVEFKWIFQILKLNLACSIIEKFVWLEPGLLFNEYTLLNVFYIFE